jgi:hypothetical protein
MQASSSYTITGGDPRAQDLGVMGFPDVHYGNVYFGSITNSVILEVRSCLASSRQ